MNNILLVIITSSSSNFENVLDLVEYFHFEPLIFFDLIVFALGLDVSLYLIGPFVIID